MEGVLPTPERLTKRNSEFLSSLVPLKAILAHEEYVVELRKKNRRNYYNSKRSLPSLESLSADASAEIKQKVEELLLRFTEPKSILKALFTLIQEIQGNAIDKAFCISVCNRYSISPENCKFIIDSELLTVVFESLRENSEGLLLQTTHLLVNLTIADTETCLKLLNYSIIEHMIYFSTNYQGEILKSSLLALINLCIDSKYVVAHLISLQFHLQLIKLVSFPVNIIPHHYELLSLLCKGIHEYSEIVQVLNICCNVFSNTQDHEILSHALWSIHFLTSHDSDQIQIFLGYSKLLEQIIEFAEMENFKISYPSIRILGNVASSNASHTQTLIEAGALPVLHRLFSSGNIKMRKESFFTLSNVTAGVAEQLKAVFASKSLVVDAFPGLVDHDHEVRSEAWHVFYNICTFRCKDFLLKLPEWGILQYAREALAIEKSHETLRIILIFCENLLVAGDCEGFNTVLSIFLESECFLEISELKEHENNKVSEIAARICDNFYPYCSYN